MFHFAHPKLLKELLFMTSYVNRRQLVEALIEELDIPISYYERAKERAQSLEDWLMRDNSSVRDLSPDVFPQGSFRYGTVIRPVDQDGFYDLDLVVTFDLTKAHVTQKQVKQLLGSEIAAYAIAKQFNDEPSEKYRCWRLNYADEVKFHMDILPGLPEGSERIVERIRMSIPAEFAQHEISITDTRHPDYKSICSTWFSSNPRGFAKWFEAIARRYAVSRMGMLVENRKYASVEEIPPFEFKTTLQRVIQILKRHRDIHFIDDATYAPISMIITTLATHAYEGQEALEQALPSVVARLPLFIKSERPRVENPVNKKEDFADKWITDFKYEQNFWAWHTQLQIDIGQMLQGHSGYLLQESVERAFDVSLPKSVFGISPAVSVKPAVLATPSPLVLPQGPRPWGA